MLANMNNTGTNDERRRSKNEKHGRLGSSSSYNKKLFFSILFLTILCFVTVAADASPFHPKSMQTKPHHDGRSRPLLANVHMLTEEQVRDSFVLPEQVGNMQPNMNSEPSTAMSDNAAVRTTAEAAEAGVDLQTYKVRGSRTLLSTEDVAPPSPPARRGIMLQAPKYTSNKTALGAAREAARLKQVNPHLPTQMMYVSSIPKLSSRAFVAVNGTIAMTGLLLDIVAGLGTPMQNVQLYIDNTGNTAIATTDIFSTGGFNTGASTTLTYPTCGSSVCTITFNGTTPEGNAFGTAGVLGRDVGRLLPTDSVYQNTTADFLVVTSKSGSWPFNSATVPPQTNQVGSFGVPVNTTECYGAVCYTGYFKQLLSDFSLTNVLGVCANYSVNTVATIGTTASSLYTGSVSYVSTATALNVTVPAELQDAVVVTNTTFNSVDLNIGNTTAMGSYATVSLDGVQILLPNASYYLWMSTLANHIDSSLATTANTPNLCDILYIALASTTAASRLSLPSFVFTVRVNATHTTTWTVPPQAYLLDFTSVNSGGLKIITTLVAVNVTTGNLQLNLPLVYSYYTVFDRVNQRIGVAEVGSTKCAIGCSSLTTESSCRNNHACGWCVDAALGTGLCIEGTPNGPASTEFNSMCNVWSYGGNTGAASGFISPTSFATVLLSSLAAAVLLG